VVEMLLAAGFVFERNCPREVSTIGSQVAHCALNASEGLQSVDRRLQSYC
jgi:hypothetical protein